MEKLMACILAAVLSCSASAHAQELPACFRPEFNTLRRNAGDGLEGFFKKLDSADSSISIWHLGDSHVQAEFFPDTLRKSFARDFPGRTFTRGLTFPYKDAHTNYLRDYVMSLSGEWSFSNLLQQGERDFGATGRRATATGPEAGISLVMNTSDDSLYHFDVLRIFGRAGRGGAELSARLADSTTIAAVSTTYGYEINLGRDTSAVDILLSIPEGGSFTLYGIVPDVTGPAFRYVSSGVNGATVAHWNRCVRLMDEASCFRPDLVIVGLGTNDAVVARGGSFNSDRFKQQYLKLLTDIRRMSPGCALILVPSNDTFLRGRDNVWTKEVEKAVLEIAGTCGAAVWDWYRLMGGAGSMQEWLDCELAGKDRIHFKKEGYGIFGDLLYKAITAEAR